MVEIAHTSGDTFDPNLQIGGQPALLQLFGSADASLSALGDVEITELANNDFLIWSELSAKWVNSPTGSMAFQNKEAVNITGGFIGGLPAPIDPGDAVNKAYVDALPAGMTAPHNTMMANVSGTIAPAIPNSLSDFLDSALGTSPVGTIIFRRSDAWAALLPGTDGTFLKTHGPGADLAWEVGGSGVVSVAAGAGITTGAGPITASGTVALQGV